MARRKDHTRNELIEMAVACGRQLVVEGGPQALTARKVAEQMGYTPGTLYNLFTNIEGLMLAVNQGSLEHLAERMAQIMIDEPEAKQCLGKFCAAYLDFHRSEPELWKLLFATPIQNESITEEYSKMVHQVFDPVVETLLPISGSRKAARQDAKIIWSTLHGVCLLQQSDKLDVSEADSAEDLIGRFLDQFYTGR